MPAIPSQIAYGSCQKIRHPIPPHPLDVGRTHTHTCVYVCVT
jgi:hypothetical protein